MKCSGEQDTTRNIPRSITLSPLHFMSYRGKFISFGTVYSTAVSWGLVSIPIWRQCPSKIPLQDLRSEGAILKNRSSLADRQKCKTSTQTTVYMDCINNSYDKTPHTVLVTLFQGSCTRVPYFTSHSVTQKCFAFLAHFEIIAMAYRLFGI